jgi:hypothetical protein
MRALDHHFRRHLFQKLSRHYNKLCQ